MLLRVWRDGQHVSFCLSNTRSLSIHSSVMTHVRICDLEVPHNGEPRVGQGHASMWHEDTQNNACMRAPHPCPVEHPFQCKQTNKQKIPESPRHEVRLHGSHGRSTPSHTAAHTRQLSKMYGQQLRTDARAHSSWRPSQRNLRAGPGIVFEKKNPQIGHMYPMLSKAFARGEGINRGRSLEAADQSQLKLRIHELQGSSPPPPPSPPLPSPA